MRWMVLTKPEEEEELAAELVAAEVPADLAELAAEVAADAAELAAELREAAVELAPAATELADEPTELPAELAALDAELASDAMVETIVEPPDTMVVTTPPAPPPMTVNRVVEAVAVRVALPVVMVVRTSEVVMAEEDAGAWR